MGEINLYKVGEDSQVTEIPPDPVDLERRVQDLIEENLNELLGITFLESEYSTGEKHGGRIDTLGLDENNSPVIIEYKKTQNQNVINQGLYYFDWLVDHKAEFENLVHNKISSGGDSWIRRLATGTSSRSTISRDGSTQRLTN